MLGVTFSPFGTAAHKVDPACLGPISAGNADGSSASGVFALRAQCGPDVRAPSNRLSVLTLIVSTLLWWVHRRHRDPVHFFSLSQRMSERLNGAAALSRPKAKNDLREIHHMTVSKSTGVLASGQLQLNYAFDLLQR